MKPKNFAATMLAATAVIYSSCTLFSGSKKDDTSKALVGKWGFVTITEKKDTVPLPDADTTDWITTLFASYHDSLGIEFNTDSSYRIYAGGAIADSGTYYVDSSSQTLYVKEDSVFKPLQIKAITDSTFEIFEPADSAVIRLRKKDSL
ncbi:DUF5004 domain-containing protein [Foetidibacter luteolus]|uniref:DUF5004 domain-containing protein n=1 Tax=Foetidibacter luteolus TaxID=2608880 RepID=UPI001A982392|nr:DUF5004 domain-containing protein [Foetidibacter luteolus]